MFGRAAGRNKIKMSNFKTNRIVIEIYQNRYIEDVNEAFNI